MKIKKSLSVKMYFLLSIIFVLLTLLLYSLQHKFYQPVTKPVTVQLQTPVPYARYYSKFLKVNFEYPVEYTVKELHNDITLKNDKKFLMIGRVASNFDTIEGYLNSLERLNKVLIVNRRELTINNMKVIKAVIQSPNKLNPDDYVYFLYPTEWTIFTISTNEKTLIPELDHIAQSFHFVP